MAVRLQPSNRGPAAGGHEHRFSAMNTGVCAVGSPVDPQPWFQALEALWSRFDPDSALSQLNRAAGRWVVVPSLLWSAVQSALAAARQTRGAFDPTILPALAASGYGRSFEQGPTPVGRPVPAGRWREVETGPGVVRLPEGVAIDLGGIGKGLAVDLVMRRIRRRWLQRKAEPTGRPAHLLVDAGGDLCVWSAPGSQPWLVEVEDPFHPGRLLGRMSLRRGAVATSSTLGRRWGEGMHHIIDPRTGRPSQSDLASVTVVAGATAKADCLATAGIVAGSEGALALLRRHRCEGLLVTREAKLIMSPGLEAFFDASVA